MTGITLTCFLCCVLFSCLFACCCNDWTQPFLLAHTPTHIHTHTHVSVLHHYNLTMIHNLKLKSINDRERERERETCTCLTQAMVSSPSFCDAPFLQVVLLGKKNARYFTGHVKHCTPQTETDGGREGNCGVIYTPVGIILIHSIVISIELKLGEFWPVCPDLLSR